jgi:putative ABC transport system permease protein
MVKIFEGDNKVQPKPIKLLNVLVIVQIGISILLAFVSISVTTQMWFIENSSKGFITKNIIDINLMKLDTIRNPKLFKNEALQVPGVVSASICMGTPLDGRGFTHIELDSQTTQLNFIYGDLDYINTLGFEVINGRGFRSKADSGNVIINEAALKYHRLDSGLVPLDDQAPKNVIGIVKNYHFRSFREKIAPVEIHLAENEEPNPFGSSRILILTEGNEKVIVTKLEDVWKRVYFSVPFEYSFVSDTYFNLYEKERNFASLITASCLVSIVITLFGLIGVTFFGAQRRLKEFAIRKVYGATVKSILDMSIRAVVIWTVIGSAIAIPVAGYCVNIWLDNFAYKSEPPFLMYLLIVFIASIITSLSVVYQTYVVARQNPADILRHE